MTVKSELSMDGAIATLPAPVLRKASVWTASQILTHLPDADPDFQRQVLRELLYELGLTTRPEPAEVLL
jgi:hypothetical protein